MCADRAISCILHDSRTYEKMGKKIVVEAESAMGFKMSGCARACRWIVSASFNRFVDKQRAVNNVHQTGDDHSVVATCQPYWSVLV